MGAGGGGLNTLLIYREHDEASIILNTVVTSCPFFIIWEVLMHVDFDLMRQLYIYNTYIYIFYLYIFP